MYLAKVYTVYPSMVNSANYLSKRGKMSKHDLSKRDIISKHFTLAW